MNQAEALHELGLSEAEARVYLQLLEEGEATAQLLADKLDRTRPTIYPALKSLAEKGLVEGGVGYGARFRPLSIEQSLASLLERERDRLHRQELLAKRLAEELVVNEAPGVPQDLVEVIQSGRTISERYARLQLETESSVEVFAKAPFVTKAGNPVQEAAMARGVQYRVVYESAILDDENVRPFIRSWVAAGESARVFDGSLPLKFALFDEGAALLPLETPEGPRPVTAVVIRHPDLAAGLHVLFDTLWQRSEPLQP